MMVEGASAALRKDMTLPELWRTRAELTPHREAYRRFDPDTGVWVSYTWAEMAERVGRWRHALHGEAVGVGARIGVLLPTGLEQVCADQAALSLGLVPVPLHVTDNPANVAYTLADSAASVLFTDSLERWHTLKEEQPELPHLRRVVYLRPTLNKSVAEIACHVDEWLNYGRETGQADSANITSDSLAAIVYTSGTTGRPKGVMLSHRNVISNIFALRDALQIADDDLFLSFLPLSHTLERTAGYYLPILAGAAVAFARSVRLLMEDLRTIRPTVLISVPRIYERMYGAMREESRAHWLRHELLRLTVHLGWRQFAASQDLEPPAGPATRYAARLLDAYVASPIRDRLGGRIRAAVAGGAPLGRDVARPFLALGIPLIQGYGTTESSPVIACNTPTDNDPETVGRPLPQVETQLGESDELLVRGENVMLGYWQRPEDTARAIDTDGWLHTGDQASIEKGRLRIKGRLKDIIVTSTGEKIAPSDLEAAILNDATFEQAMVIGEQRPYIVALLVLNMARWGEAAPGLGLDPLAPSSVNSTTASCWALGRIRRATSAFPSYAMPGAALLSVTPWTVDNGMMTPTLKPKRSAIEARYAKEIEALYVGRTLN